LQRQLENHKELKAELSDNQVVCFDWLTDWLIDWLIDWLTDWLIDWLINGGVRNPHGTKNLMQPIKHWRRLIDWTLV
jgi:hypothetical protein